MDYTYFQHIIRTYYNYTPLRHHCDNTAWWFQQQHAALTKSSTGEPMGWFQETSEFPWFFPWNMGLSESFCIKLSQKNQPRFQWPVLPWCRMEYVHYPVQVGKVPGRRMRCVEKGPFWWGKYRAPCMWEIHDDIDVELYGSEMVPKWREPDFFFIGGCPSCSSFEGDHDFDICWLRCMLFAMNTERT